MNRTEEDWESGSGEKSMRSPDPPILLPVSMCRSFGTSVLYLGPDGLKSRPHSLSFALVVGLRMDQGVGVGTGQRECGRG